jgi:CRP-like cAMP-binding protein/Zn-dependent protease
MPMDGTTGLTGIWTDLSRAVAANGAAERGAGKLWSRLAERLDPAQFKPRLAPDVEIKDFPLRWGNDYAMIANPRDLLHYRLEPWEAELVRLMDGTRTVKEIVLSRFEESGEFELSGVADLVYELYIGNFLDVPYVDVDAILDRALHPVSPARERLRRFVKTLTIEWKGADRLVQFVYRNGLKWFFRPIPQLMGAALAVGGFVAFLTVVRSKGLVLAGDSLGLGVLILLGLNYFLTFVHELGHAVVLTHNGRRIKSAGFMIYFGSPAFFVESSDALMMDRGQRILQAAAGPYAEMIFAGIASFTVVAFPDGPAANLLYQFAVLNYFVLFLNLIPLLELDGYWILSDAIQVPNLRPLSLAFIRHDLWHKLRHRERFTPQEIGLGLYGVVGVAFTIFTLYTAYFFWESIFGGLVRRLWDGGLPTRILLVVLAVFLGGPLIRGAARLLRSIYLRVRGRIRRVQFKLESRWRVEAAELIEALPLFEDVPVEVLNDLAGRVRLRSLRPGQPVVRQGELPEAFYVVRRGTLEVIEEDRSTGSERVLRSLGRGAAFGEIGLVESRPRSATVRAGDDAEVFEIDKGTFDRLLADLATAPDYGPTFQHVAELRELPSFAHLESDQLAELLAEGAWVNVAPGETLVTQGEPGDSFWVIRSGQVHVIQDGTAVRTLGPGSHFGEVALLLDVPRTATVRARTAVRAFRLRREGFDRLVAEAFRKGALRPHLPSDRTWHH